MKVYDLENHYYPKELLEYIKTRTEYPCYVDTWGGCIAYSESALLGAGAPAFNPPVPVQDEMMDVADYRISRLDYAGVTTAVISAAALAEYLPKEESIKYAKLANDRLAEASKKYPGRFLGTICLPTLYVDEALEELERAVKVLGLKYWHTHSNYGKEFIYEDKFEPILAKCAELDIPFYIHPQNPSTEFLLDSGMTFASAGFGYAVDVMKTSMRLIMKGTFDKYPNLKMIIGHMGEFYPFILDRMDNRFNVGKATGLDPVLQFKESFSYYFKNKNIFVTTSGIFDETVILTTIKNIGIDNIMYGSDFPYEYYKEHVDFVKNLPISDEDKEKILYKNAEKYILKISE